MPLLAVDGVSSVKCIDFFFLSIRKLINICKSFNRSFLIDCRKVDFRLKQKTRYIYLLIFFFKYSDSSKGSNTSFSNHPSFSVGRGCLFILHFLNSYPFFRISTSFKRSLTPISLQVSNR